MMKAGFKAGKQKWKCGECGRRQGETDGREKYTEKEKKIAETLYL